MRTRQQSIIVRCLLVVPVNSGMRAHQRGSPPPPPPQSPARRSPQIGALAVRVLSGLPAPGFQTGASWCHCWMVIGRLITNYSLIKTLLWQQSGIFQCNILTDVNLLTLLLLLNQLMRCIYKIQLETFHFIHKAHFRIPSFPKCCTKYLNKTK